MLFLNKKKILHSNFQFKVCQPSQKSHPRIENQTARPEPISHAVIKKAFVIDYAPV